MATSRRGRRKPSSSKSDRGFTAPASEIETSESGGGKQIYSMPALYDLAFGYRNFDEEIDFLVGQHQALHGGKGPARVLELAAGPARHCIYALQSSKLSSATALDNSMEMVEYSKSIAQEELDIDTFENSFTYLKEDMSDFELASSDPFDSAWILLGSLQHMTTNAKVISCFQSINKALVEGGTLILELPHPRETFSLVECTRNSWEVPLEDEEGETSGELEIIWGDNNDEFDPIKQVRQFTVAMELKGIENDDLQNIREVVPMRLFTAQEISALAQIVGFEVTSMHGALVEGVDVNDENEAFRLVCVLRKI
jgi:SAM-dependent methyltransferase